MKQMEAARAIANAILYEGYMLYPYRRSALKNQRPGWSFGTLVPPAYAATNPGESAAMGAEVLAHTKGDARVTVEARFLQLNAREPDAAIERTVIKQAASKELIDGCCETEFNFPSPGDLEKTTILGILQLRAECVNHDLLKINLNLRNESVVEPACSRRDDILPHSLIAAHGLMFIENGEFVSLLDPPESLRAHAAACHQSGVFPVLTGDAGRRNAVLLSPIILYDYPQIAPESRGDFFDGSEIDEMLTLRVLTLSDSEKNEIRRSGGQGREILGRTESIMPEEMLKLHGAYRDARRKEGGAMKNSDFFGTAPREQSISVFGVELKSGSQVRLWPQRRADIFDMALAGKLATIEAIERTLEGDIHIAVTIDDDPGADLGLARQIGHRFFFRADEVEPVVLDSRATEQP